MTATTASFLTIHKTHKSMSIYTWVFWKNIIIHRGYKTNEDKTMLFITSQPKHKEEFNNIEIHDVENTYSVELQSQLRKLGFTCN